MNMSGQGATGSTPIYWPYGQDRAIKWSMIDTPLAHSGTKITVRVTPRATRNRVTHENKQTRVYVTEAPDKGKANAATQKLLSKALGVAKSRLRLIQGHTTRDKTFAID